MLWLSHTHAASASVAAVRLDHWLPDGPCLCVAQHASLAFYALSEGRASRDTSYINRPLACVQRVPLRARIIAIDVVRSLSKDESDRILLLTDHPVPRLLVLRRGATEADDARPNPWADISTEASLVLQDAVRSPAELGLGLCTEPALDLRLASGSRPGRWAATHTHTGQMRMIPIEESVPPVHTELAFNARYVVLLTQPSPCRPAL